MKRRREEEERERNREMTWLIKVSYERGRKRKNLRRGKEILGLEKQVKKVNGMRIC